MARIARVARIDRRENLLDGKLDFPQQILDLLECDETDQLAILDFWKHLFRCFLEEKPCDIIHFMDDINPNLFNKTLYHLSKAGWIETFVIKNHTSVSLRSEKLLKWLTPQELRSFIRKSKVMAHTLPTHGNAKVCNITKNRKYGYAYVGLRRAGFALHGRDKFQYDTDMLRKYLPEILKNLKKGLSKSNKLITYQEVVDTIVKGYLAHPELYFCLGKCVSDSRGRSIFEATHASFAPIGSKDARALIKIAPQPLTKDGRDAVALFVAELLGIKTKTWKEKVSLGYEAWRNQSMPKTFSHESMWLERIYNADINNWSIPIEVDAQCSVVQYFACLRNDHELMDSTNLIRPDHLGDAWTIPGLSRTQVKKFMTPQIYGSVQDPEDLWLRNGVKYTIKQLTKARSLLEEGRFKGILDMKNDIINGASMKDAFKVHIGDEIFTITCNKFKEDEEESQEYMVYSSDHNRLMPVRRIVKHTPDLERFRTYTATCLIHNLDSQVANALCLRHHSIFMLPNHDAFILHPNNAKDVRNSYVDIMYNMVYKRRKQILQNYLNSINNLAVFEDTDKEEVPYFEVSCMK